MPDRMKPSRLLLRLEAEIASARSRVEADCKRAERAAYLARLGRVEEASQELAELQRRNSQTSHIEVSIRANLAEGLIAYFSNVGVSTTDRVQRAYALSVAAGMNPLRALCAAWLAQWDYARLDMSELAKHVREALKYADTQNHAARSRACLVAAQALHLAGRLDLAKVWYARSRVSAVEEGDDVTISALMHNMAWLRMLTMRQAVLTGEGDANVGRYALVNATSTENLDEMTGDSSWQELKPILRAQIASLRGDPGQALALYERHLSAADAPSRLQANLLADKAWCHVALGQSSKAAESAELALGSLIRETQGDDRAATHSRLAQVFSALGDTERETYHYEQAGSTWEAHVNMQATAVELLSGLDEDGKNVL